MNAVVPEGRLVSAASIGGVGQVAVPRRPAQVAEAEEAQFEGADVDAGRPVAVAVRDPREPALVGVRRSIASMPRVDGGAARQEGVGFGRAAVVLQRARASGRGGDGAAALVPGVYQATGAVAVQVGTERDQETPPSFRQFPPAPLLATRLFPTCIAAPPRLRIPPPSVGPVAEECQC